MSPWPPNYWISIVTHSLRTSEGVTPMPAALLPLMSQVLTVPGAPFSVAPNDVVTIWFCRRGQ